MVADAAPRVPSPCVRNCCLDEDICIGCGRSVAEIMNWSAATDGERREILLAAQKRIFLREQATRPRS